MVGSLDLQTCYVHLICTDNVVIEIASCVQFLKACASCAGNNGSQLNKSIVQCIGHQYLSLYPLYVHWHHLV